jgi:hypothetical protein
MQSDGEVGHFEVNGQPSPLVNRPDVSEPVLELARFTARQKLARLFAVQTEPWCSNCLVDFSTNDPALVELVKSCDDLKLYINRKCHSTGAKKRVDYY